MSLILRCSLSTNTIPAGSEPRLVYLLLEVEAEAEAAPIQEDHSANLAFVIDVSESMRVRLVTHQEFAELARNGLAQEVLTDGIPTYQISQASGDWVARLPRRIDSVIQALQMAGEYLRPDDWFSLVAFAGQAQCLIPLTQGRERERLQRAVYELETLNLGDGTEMASGMALAMGQLQEYTDKSERQGTAVQQHSTAARMILLTDGHTRNVGECYAWARKANLAGIKIATMGIGVEFNEDLLIPLADLTGGSAYFIETPAQLPEVFRQELGSALHVRYGDVEIKLRLTEGVELRRVYRVLPEMGLFDSGPNMDSSYSLSIGDFNPDAPVGLLVELVVQPAQPGAYRIAQSMLAWDNPPSSTLSPLAALDRRGDRTDGGRDKTPHKELRVEEASLRQNIRQDIVLERVLVTQDQSPANQEDPTRNEILSQTKSYLAHQRVLQFVDKAGAFRMGTLALEVAQAASQATGTQPGEVLARQTATVRLRQAGTRLLDMGETALAGAMFQQAEMLEQEGNLDPEAMKKLRYATRRLTRNL